VNSSEGKEQSSSDLMMVTDVLSKAYVAVGRSEVVLEESRSMVKETRNELASLRSDLKGVRTSIEWIKWILAVGFSGFSFATLVLKILFP